VCPTLFFGVSFRLITLAMARVFNDAMWWSRNVNFLYILL
jgi:hypothetical protein